REVVWDAGGGGAAREGQPGSDMPPSSPSWSMEGSSGTAVSTSGGGVVGEASRVGVVRVEGAGIGAGMAMSTGVVRSWFTRPRLGAGVKVIFRRSEEHTSELQSRFDLVCRLLLEKKN